MKVRRGHKYTAAQRKADNDLNAAKRLADNQTASHWHLGAVYPSNKIDIQHFIEVMHTYIKQRQEGITCLLGNRIGEVIKAKEDLQERLSKLNKV